MGACFHRSSADNYKMMNQSLGGLPWPDISFAAVDTVAKVSGRCYYNLMYSGDNLEHKRVFFMLPYKADSTVNVPVVHRLKGSMVEGGGETMHVVTVQILAGEKSAFLDLAPEFVTGFDGYIEESYTLLSDDLLPVEFKTYPDTEAGPDKAHKKNLKTRQDETAKHGTGWEKVVCKIWDSSAGKVNLIDYLDGGPGNHSTYENVVKWRVNGTEQTSHELSLGAKPGSEKHTHYYVQVMPKNGGDTLDRLIITVVPPETKTKFDNWYATESTAAGKAWFAECPRMPSSLEISPLQSPDSLFSPRIWRDPSDWSAAGGGTYFHPDAYYEIRAEKTPGGHGHQTTFDKTGDLILSSVSAGTADKAAAFYFPGNLDIYSHVHADVEPFMWALQLDGNPCDQDTTTLTMPMLHEGAFIKKYMECRPPEPNAKPRFAPGGPP